jgi:hypothetical protein
MEKYTKAVFDGRFNMIVGAVVGDIFKPQPSDDFNYSVLGEKKTAVLTDIERKLDATFDLDLPCYGALLNDQTIGDTKKWVEGILSRHGRLTE